MQELKLRDLTLSECKLAGAELFHTKLAGVDFTTCETDGLVVAAEDLRGGVFTAAQAVGLARLLGIIIK